MSDPIPLRPRHRPGPRLVAAALRPIEAPAVDAGGLARGIPVIGMVDAGGVVTFHPGGREHLDALMARLHPRR